jgi:hypothetical protein
MKLLLETDRKVTGQPPDKQIEEQRKQLEGRLR